MGLGVKIGAIISTFLLNFAQFCYFIVRKCSTIIHTDGFQKIFYYFALKCSVEITRFFKKRIKTTYVGQYNLQVILDFSQ